MVSALYEAGFLKLRKDGLWSLYSIDKDAMKGYRSDLVQAVKKAWKAVGWQSGWGRGAGRGKKENSCFLVILVRKDAIIYSAINNSAPIYRG